MCHFAPYQTLVATDRINLFLQTVLGALQNASPRQIKPYIVSNQRTQTHTLPDRGASRTQRATTVQWSANSGQVRPMAQHDGRVRSHAAEDDTAGPYPMPLTGREGAGKLADAVMHQMLRNWTCHQPTITLASTRGVKQSVCRQVTAPVTRTVALSN